MYTQKFLAVFMTFAHAHFVDERCSYCYTRLCFRLSDVIPGASFPRLCKQKNSLGNKQTQWQHTWRLAVFPHARGLRITPCLKESPTRGAQQTAISVLPELAGIPHLQILTQCCKVMISRSVHLYLSTKGSSLSTQKWGTISTTTEPEESPADAQQ